MKNITACKHCCTIIHYIQILIWGFNSLKLIHKRHIISMHFQLFSNISLLDVIVFARIKKNIFIQFQMKDFYTSTNQLLYFRCRNRIFSSLNMKSIFHYSLLQHWTCKMFSAGTEQTRVYCIYSIYEYENIYIFFSSNSLSNLPIGIVQSWLIMNSE